MTKKDIIENYEKALINPKKNGPDPHYFNKMGGGQRNAEKYTLSLVAFAIEEILNYSPREAYMYLTKDMLEKLKLLSTIEKYVEFPSGLPDDMYITYLLSLIYPTQIHFSWAKFVTSIYISVTENTKKTPKTKATKRSYPKKFFSGSTGEYNAMICLNTAINTKIKNSSPEELYEMFSNKKKGLQLLKSLKLNIPCKLKFGNDPLEYLHYSLPDEYKNDFLYHFYKFNNSLTQFLNGVEEDNSTDADNTSDDNDNQE